MDPPPNIMTCAVCVKTTGAFPPPENPLRAASDCHNLTACAAAMCPAAIATSHVVGAPARAAVFFKKYSKSILRI